MKNYQLNRSKRTKQYLILINTINRMLIDVKLVCCICFIFCNLNEMNKVCFNIHIIVC